jgi:hypothetical protein
MHSAPGAIEIVHFTVSCDKANGVRSLMQMGLACAARPDRTDAARTKPDSNTDLVRILGNSTSLRRMMPSYICFARRIKWDFGKGVTD